MKKLSFIVMFICSVAFVNAQRNITLSVDVSAFDGTVSMVKVNGGFSAWSAYELTNTSGSIWEVTVPMSDGTTDYRYEIIDDTEGWHPEWPDNDATGSCFVNGNMRGITVSKDSVLETVCWESCTACDVELPQVTLTINMSSYMQDYGTVSVNGGFNDWGSAYELTNTTGSIWSVTLPMDTGDNDYRFEVSGGTVGWAAEWPGNDAVGDCFINGNMRSVYILKDTVLPTVCWESCNDCVATFANANAALSLDIILSSNNELSFNGKAGQALVSVINVNGQKVLEVEDFELSRQLSLNDFASGVYIVSVQDSDALTVSKVMVK